MVGTSGYAIETVNLSKRFGDVTAVDGLSLAVTRGEIYAFLGLNGAGKTTTIRMLLQMIRPTAGAAMLLGRPLYSSKMPPWDDVGYLVETPHAYPELTVRENLDIVRRLRPGIERRAVSDVIDRLGLARFADRRTGTLSHGNAQRLGLAKALLHHPALLILDEPSNGLDPAGIVEIRRLLLGLARNHGVTIFMSSHILAEIARLADRIGIIHQGKLIEERAAAELLLKRRRALQIGTRDVKAAHAVLVQNGYKAARLENAFISVSDGAAVDRPEVVNELLVNAGHPPSMLSVEQEDLERYFLRMVGMTDTEPA